MFDCISRMSFLQLSTNFISFHINSISINPLKQSLNKSLIKFNQIISTAVRSRSESTFQIRERHCLSPQSDYDEQMNELKIAEEQAKKAMADAARLAEELRQEQEHAGQIEKLRRALEQQLKELQLRLDESEATAMHGGKKTIQKLEQRVRELEVELEAEQHRHAETQKGLRKQDRRQQELALQVEEDHKAQERMHDMIDKLQQKIKAYKHQVEEAVSRRE